TSSLHISSAVAAAAHRVAALLPALREHSWVHAVTSYCLDQIASREGAENAIELRYVVELLDALHDREPAAGEHLRRFRATIPPSGVVAVEGGVEDEAMRVLDFAPLPQRRARALFDAGVVDAEVARLAAMQRDDGGWPDEWATV